MNAEQPLPYKRKTDMLEKTTYIAEFVAPDGSVQEVPLPSKDQFDANNEAFRIFGAHLVAVYSVTQSRTGVGYYRNLNREAFELEHGR